MAQADTSDLSLYSWRQTRPRTELALGDVVERIGRAVDIALHLVPALIAVVLMVMAFQMAQSADAGRASERRPVAEVHQLDVPRR